MTEAGLSHDLFGVTSFDMMRASPDAKLLYAAAKAAYETALLMPGKHSPSWEKRHMVEVKAGASFKIMTQSSAVGTIGPDLNDVVVMNGPCRIILMVPKSPEVGA